MAPAAWLYALILRLYPRAFRARCGAPMLRTFDETCRAARRRGRLRFLRVCAAEYVDAIAGAWRSRRPARRAAAAPGATESPVAAALQDAVYAGRRLRSQPAVVGFTVLTLGFAIAANAALFSVIDAVLLRPSPFAAPDRLFQVINQSPRGITYPGLSAMKLRQ
jgi:hypothetical protein